MGFLFTPTKRDSKTIKRVIDVIGPVIKSKNPIDDKVSLYVVETDCVVMDMKAEEAQMFNWPKDTILLVFLHRGSFFREDSQEDKAVRKELREEIPKAWLEQGKQQFNLLVFFVEGSDFSIALPSIGKLSTA